jgi:hypothetical protein
VKRVGHCFIDSRDGIRRNEYEILRGIYGGLFIRYIGYRQGDLIVGLPLAGPNAAHMQVLLHYEEHRGLLSDITFFEEEKP